MKKTLTTNDIVDALRADDSAAWTYAGARAMAEYLEELEETTEEETELDVVAIRCIYAEFASAMEAARDYNYTGQATEKDAREWFSDRTTLIEFEQGIIIAEF